MRESERLIRTVMALVMIAGFLAPASISKASGAVIVGQERTPPGHERIKPGDAGPRIVSLSAPTQIEAGRKLEVAVTAADKSGVGFVDVWFGADRRRVEAKGELVVNLVLEFETAVIGLEKIQARAFGIDGRTEGPVSSLEVNIVNRFTILDSGDGPIVEGDANYPFDSGGITVMSFPGVLEIDGRPWWNQWVEKYAKPFDWQSACPGADAGVTPKGEVLRCWLSLHPEVRNHLIWEDITYTKMDQIGTPIAKADPVVYDDWHFINKGLLDQSFYEAYNYLKSGAKVYGGPPVPDIPTNQIITDDAEEPYTFFYGSDAKRLYLATVAHSLALEIGGFLPWSVTTYTPEDLEILFNSHHLLSVAYEAWTLNGKFRSFSGYAPVGDKDGGSVIPAPPVTIFNFLLANNVIRGNHINTVGELLEWGRKHQIHIASNGSGLVNYPTLLNESVWHYRGYAPAARMMSLTLYEDPFNHQILGTGPMAWTDGCDGAASFLQAELRAANIPVAFVRHMGGTAHSTPLFRTIDRTLSHGDDVMDVRWAQSTPEGPAKSILIPVSKFNDWFYGPNITDPYFNVGRQVLELSLQWLSNNFLTRYCADKAANKTHANGSVFQAFVDPYSSVPYYTVQELEAMDLWTKLSVKAAKLGYCKP